MEQWIQLTPDNLHNEHLCCAIADKKHQAGVEAKRGWLAKRIQEGHVFRKLDQKGKVFIEYAPLETAWVPVIGHNYLYIYCLWVSGSFKGKGYGQQLLDHCIEDAKSRQKSGICVLSSRKKKPFLTEKKFVQRFGFEVVDRWGDYELLALSFDGAHPQFSPSMKQPEEAGDGLTIYYGLQCPYVPDCIRQVRGYCDEHGIPLRLIPVETLEQAKSLPCPFNNWALFVNGRFQSLHLLNEGYLKKLLDQLV